MPTDTPSGAAQQVYFLSFIKFSTSTLSSIRIEACQMKTYYHYALYVILTFAAVAVCTIIVDVIRSLKAPLNGAGYSVFLALMGPMIVAWLLAVGWVYAILYRKFIAHDPDLSQTTLIIAFIIGFFVATAPLSVYQTFFVTETIKPSPRESGRIDPPDALNSSQE